MLMFHMLAMDGSGGGWQTITAPPAGHDSGEIVHTPGKDRAALQRLPDGMHGSTLTMPCLAVLGETGQGLNYDEVVVYRNDAIIPRYLLYYTLPNKQ